MKESRVVQMLLMALTVVLGGLIIAYYWSVDDWAAMKKVPMYVMIFALGYILIQIARRYITSSKKWWDWFYYIGLTSMILPIFFSTPERQVIFNYLTDFGSFFFVIPTLLDGREFMQKSA